MSAALTRVATYRLSPYTTLCIAQGSVVDFTFSSKLNPPPKAAAAAIVNAANEECLGGGGVDGAITKAGGPNLAKDRKALLPKPKQHRRRMGTGVVVRVRCATGNAKITGPGDYGTLHVPYVIHAVGPNYAACSSLQKGDKLLRMAYEASLKRAQEAKLEAVAFSLLSAGIYRGEQSVTNVLGIAVTAIQKWVQLRQQQEDVTTTTVVSLTHVFLCGFSPKEVDTLVEICTGLELERVPDSEL
jgi:O-acetyl-ADP-ribose deacetylase (regulator of RNase III)